MKVRTIDAIRMMNVREVAKIIGAIVLMQTKGLSAEEGLKYEYHATEKVLLKEIEINRNQTNAERIRSMSDEELAEFVTGISKHCLAGIGECDCSSEKDCGDNCRRKVSDWLCSDSKETFRHIQDNSHSSGWIPVSAKVPETDSYVLLSFENFSLPLVGRYETDEEGGAFYIGDDEETCVSQDIFVNAWQPLPEPYREGE